MGQEDWFSSGVHEGPQLGPAVDFEVAVRAVDAEFFVTVDPSLFVWFVLVDAVEASSGQW